VENDGDERWIESNMLAFERLEAALRRLGEACIATLRQHAGPEWTVAFLAWGLEVRTPRNLDAPPDSALADLLLSHWARTVANGRSYQRDPALLCVLGWAVEWCSALDVGSWPPSSV
jgi:hypothetical protein